MKYLLLSCLFSFTLNISLAQQIAPKSVELAFSERYPTIENPFWEYREGAIVAMFSAYDGLKKVFFHNDGTWLETRTRLGLEDLPTGVSKFVNKNYKNADITFVGKVEHPDGIRYRVESELTSAIVIKLLSAEGKLLNKERIAINRNQSVQIVSNPLPKLQIKPVKSEKK